MKTKKKDLGARQKARVTPSSSHHAEPPIKAPMFLIPVASVKYHAGPSRVVPMLPQKKVWVPGGFEDFSEFLICIFDILIISLIAS